MHQVTAPSRFRVVLADDAPDIRYLLRLILEFESVFEIVGEAGTGKQAVELARTEGPDLMILDLAMPEMDGLEALSRILEVAPETRVVVFSGFDESSLAEEALNRGARAYVSKGTQPADLVARLREVCKADDQAAADQAKEPSGRGQDDDEAAASILASVTHELRNQSTVIEGMTGMILNRLRDLPIQTIEDALLSIARNAAQMHSLIDALSDFRRVQNEDFDLRLVPTDVVALTRDIVEDTRSLTSPRPVNITGSENGIGLLDPVRFRQVVTNLLSNAAKFSPEDKPIDISVVAAEGAFEVRVRDYGDGIPKHREGELFRPFSRFDPRVGGSGLGLYISRGVARTQGGDVVLVSNDDGACFGFRIPAAPADPRPAD